MAIVASLVSGEFLPRPRKPILFGALALAMVTLRSCCSARRSPSSSTAMANLYAYFAGTAVMIVLLLLAPPSRPMRWLSSLAGRAEDE